MDARQIIKIRNARGLNTNEKMFLVTIASHDNGMFGAWQKNADDMAMLKDTYYRTKNSLTEKNLIDTRRRHNNSTVFTINEDVLDSLTANADSHTANQDSLTENDHSHQTEPKVNMKGNKKVNLKGNPTSVADAPSVTPNKEESMAAQPPVEDSSYSTSSVEIDLIPKVTEEAAKPQETDNTDRPASPARNSSVIQTAPTPYTEAQDICNTVQGNSAGDDSLRENRAKEALDQVIDQHDRAGDAREDWSDVLYKEALAEVLNVAGSSSMYKRAFNAYASVGRVLEW